MNPRIVYLAIIALLFVSSSHAQRYDDDGNIILPRGLAPGEVVPSPSPLTTLTNPPTEPVRAVAEWEEVEAIMVRWPNDNTFNNLWAQFLEPIATKVKIYVICASQTQVNAAMNLFDNTMPLDSFVFQIHSSNSIWIRDYGPWWIWQQTSWDRGIVDWIYNRPRPLDDVIPEWQAGSVYNVDYYGPNLIYTGGNFMVDGWGKGFCSKLYIDDNPGGVNTVAELDSVHGAFMNLDTVYTFPRFFGIDHIDMSMKLLNDHTCILNQYPAGNQFTDEMDTCETILEQITNPWGQPMQVHRIQTASWDGGTAFTYTNALLVNDDVLLPIYGGTHATRDAAAIALWDSLLPGYAIHSYNCSSIIPLQGAIHCVTKDIIHRYLIRIEYPPLPEQLESFDDAEIRARIVSLGTLNPDSIQLFYAFAPAGPWFDQTFESLGNDSFRVQLTDAQPNETVYYYVRAKNTEGNWTTMPRYGPEAHYQTTFPNVPSVIPAAADSLTIYPTATSVQLHWAPVTEDINGNPISDVIYYVFGSNDEESLSLPDRQIGTTTTTSFVVDDSFMVSDQMFFMVKAFVP